MTERVLGYSSTDNLVSGATENSLPWRDFSHDAAGNMIENDRDGTVYEYRHNNRSWLDRISVNSQVRADFVGDCLLVSNLLRIQDA